MTVGELIEILKNINPDTTVIIKTPDPAATIWPDGGYYRIYDEISEEDIVLDSEGFKIILGD